MHHRWIRTAFWAVVVVGVTAIPASAWPIGLGMSRLSSQILRSPGLTGESVVYCKLLIYSQFLLSVHVIALDFRPGTPLE